MEVCPHAKSKNVLLSIICCLYDQLCQISHLFEREIELFDFEDKIDLIGIDNAENCVTEDKF